MAEPSPNNGHWWLARKSKGKHDLNKELAQAVSRCAVAIETRNQPERWRSYVYARLMTGRPFIAQYAYSMSKRPSTFAAYYGSYDFEPSRTGYAGMLCDVYVNRLLSHETFIEFIPDDDEFSDRQLAEDIDAWLEGAKEDLRFTDTFKRMGLDGLYFGSGWLKFVESMRGKPDVENKHKDELLWRNPDLDLREQRDVIERVWASRVDLLRRYGGTKGSPLYEAIVNAPSAFPYCWFGPGMLACDDVVPLLRAYRLPEVDDEPGRTCLIIGGVTVEDDGYTDNELPYEKWDFHQLPGSIDGQGLAEILLPIAEEIDRLALAIQESWMRVGYAKWLVEENSSVNPAALGDLIGNVVKYLGTKPELATPTPVSPAAVQTLQWWIEHGMNRAHINLNALKGDVPKALDSAVAIERYAQIDDANFAEMIGRLEETQKRAAYQIVRLAKKLKPEYRRPNGSQIIKWEDLKIKDERPIRLRAYNVGRLGQTVAGRTEELEKLLAAGRISREQANKYEQVPNTRSLLDQINAPTEGVDRVLDKLVLKSRYIPPSPYMDVQYAKQAVEARIILEEGRNTPRKVVDRLRMWRAAVIEMIAANAPPVTGIVPPAAGPGKPVGTSGEIPGVPVDINNPAEAEQPPQQAAA